MTAKDKRGSFERAVFGSHYTITIGIVPNTIYLHPSSIPMTEIFFDPASPARRFAFNSAITSNIVLDLLHAY